MPSRQHQLPRTGNPSQSRPVEHWIRELICGMYKEREGLALCICLPFRVALERGLRPNEGAPSTHFLTKRVSDGFVSASSMMIYAFPTMSPEDTRKENAYIHALSHRHGKATMYDIGSLWVAPEIASVLARHYDMQHVVTAITSRVELWTMMRLQSPLVGFIEGEDGQVRARMKRIDAKDQVLMEARIHPRPFEIHTETDNRALEPCANIERHHQPYQQIETPGNASQWKRNLGAKFFDYQEPSTDHQAMVGADNFFADDRHMKRVQAFFSTIRRENQRRVKIAVLDTGLDMKHPILADFVKRKQIGEELGRDFTMQSPRERSLKDNIGHGTACTHLLLKTCPTAVVYTAKISNKELFEEATGHSIAQAIRTAVTEWDVDIISMYFSYEYEVGIIKQALLEAEFEKRGSVLFFAASGNFGKAEYPDTAGFPARHRNVICASSSTHQGDKSHFNRGHDTMNGWKNFSIIGEHLCVAFPAELNLENFQRRLSGTSMATLIMAGIAALVLEFCNIWKERHGKPTLEKAATMEGMLQIFHKCMLSNSNSSPQQGHLNLYPWHLFDGGCDPTLVGNQIAKALQHL